MLTLMPAVESGRLWDSQGLVVSRLKRVRYGAAFLPKRLRTGQWSEISPQDHTVLREDCGLAAAGERLVLLNPKTRNRPPVKKKKARKHRRR